MDNFSIKYKIMYREKYFQNLITPTKKKNETKL